MRPTITALAASVTTPDAAESLLRSPGMSALSLFERAGMVKRVTPLARPVEEERMILAAPGITATIASTVGGLSTTDFNSGVSLVELERDADVPTLQSSLANDPHVEFVSRVPVRYLVVQDQSSMQTSSSGTTITAPPPPASTLCNLAKIYWPQIRSQGGFKTATDIRVAVLDTGIDADHPDLHGRVSQYHFTYPGLTLRSGERDIIGHGTHVSGTIGALINNDIGINGICEGQLLMWKIFDDKADLCEDSNSASYVYYVEPVMYRRALADCLDQGVDVINLSIGGPGKPDPQEQSLINALLANGTTIVAAMGNEREYGSPTSYPAAIPGVIAVGATSLDDTVADFSNRGDHISLCAPGVAIWSTLPTHPGQFGFEAVKGPGGKWIEGRRLRRKTNYDAWDGTSMATPHVTATVALLLSNKGKMNAASVRKQLMKTADHVAGMGGKNFDPDYGAGRLEICCVF